jgi:hypothetical protein
MAIPLHVWLQLYDDLYALPQIIDITADQGVGIHETVLLGTGYKLSKEKGLVYLVGNLFEKPADIKPQTQQRARLLRDRLQTLSQSPKA